MTPFYNIAVECASLLKSNKVNAAICIGGPHLTIMEEKAFNDPFDYAFVGDGEDAWIKFLQAIENKKDFYIITIE